MSLHLYNSLTRRLEPFAPLDSACPTMYLCGPTVYNYVHIGNARGPVVFGVLADVLRRRHGALRYARNITDVDDKINAADKNETQDHDAIIPHPSHNQLNYSEALLSFFESVSIASVLTFHDLLSG